MTFSHLLSSSLTMSQADFLPLLKFRVKICQFLRCVSLEWDEKQGTFIKTRSSQKFRHFKFQCIISVTYCTAMILNLIFGPLPQTSKFQGAALFMIALIGTATRLVYDNSGVQILNTFASFERKVVQGN